MAVTGATRIGDAEGLLHLVPPVVGPEDTLPALVGAVASDPRARCAFVAGEGGELLGVVREEDLDRDLVLLLAPSAVAGAGELGPRALARVAHGLNETARELMRRSAQVTARDTLVDALARMRECDLTTAALVSPSGELLGYISLFEVLSALIGVASPVAS